MNTIEDILSRSSVREFTNQAISVDDLHTILKAGMSGPSCVNAKDWSFVVVQDKKRLNEMADANGAPANPLRKCDVAIMVCGDLTRAFPPAKEYWVIDCAIAAQNMVLAAQALGIGSVWLGTWPQLERVEKQAILTNLPESIVPHSILAFGYPDKEMPEKADCYDSTRVHNERW